MKSKTYSIVYKIGREQKTISCSCYSLQKYVDRFVNEGGELICIVAHKQKEKEKKPKDINKAEMQRYYNNKYSNYQKQYKVGKLNEQEFEEIKKVLKELKSESKTKEEFEDKFIEYQNKKNTNNIPPYNVSD